MHSRSVPEDVYYDQLSVVQPVAPRNDSNSYRCTERRVIWDDDPTDNTIFVCNTHVLVAGTPVVFLHIADHSIFVRDAMNWSADCAVSNICLHVACSNLQFKTEKIAEQFNLEKSVGCF